MMKHLVILVNKMDDPTVEWDKSRLLEVECLQITPLCSDSTCTNGHILGICRQTQKLEPTCSG